MESFFVYRTQASKTPETRERRLQPLTGRPENEQDGQNFNRTTKKLTRSPKSLTGRRKNLLGWQKNEQGSIKLNRAGKNQTTILNRTQSPS